MIDGWNERLKECREKNGYTLKGLESKSMLDLSQQSLIKYEKGEVYPRINILEKMCRLYGTTIEYVLYGDNKTAPFEDRSNSLVTLFMLLCTNKIAYDRVKQNIVILDGNLQFQLSLLDDFKNTTDISSLDDLNKLITGIKKIRDDK